MFETYYTPRLTPHALGAPNIGERAGVWRRWRWRGEVWAEPHQLCPAPSSQPLPSLWSSSRHLGLPAADRNYYQCWVGLTSHFDPSWTPEKAAAAEAAAAAGSKAAGGSATPAAGGGGG